jgi:hypothetical protein
LRALFHISATEDAFGTRVTLRGDSPSEPETKNPGMKAGACDAAAYIRPATTGKTYLESLTKLRRPGLF